MNRKMFLGAAVGVAALPLLGYGTTGFLEKEKLPASLVEEFVRQAHKDLDRVKEMLGEHPTLVNASHDWGNGDFEQGLDGACHVGNKEIVNYLLDKGAPPTIFSMALFGQANLLKAWLEWSPESLYAKGPHGFSLLHHANLGGEDALELKAMLLSKGLKETKFNLF